MKRYEFSGFCLMAAIAVNIHSVAGQTVASVTQISSPRAVPAHGAPAARPVASMAVTPHVTARPTGFASQRFSPYVVRSIVQPGPNLQPNYSPVVRPLNQTFAALRAQRLARVGSPGMTALDSARRERVMRALEAIRQRRGFRAENPKIATMNAQRDLATHDPAIRHQLQAPEAPEDKARTKSWNKDDRLSYVDACRRHEHEWHDRGWWQDHCDTIVFVNNAYYFLDGSYWYPAFGYDPLYSSYDYDGPVYTYGNLLPDEVIANVQVALQDAGYYLGEITGSLDAETRVAIANFQRDYGLPITGAIDDLTVEALGSH